MGTSSLDYYHNLWSRLPHDVSANLEFAKYVIEREKYNSSFFFGDYSAPILRWIILTLFHNKDIEVLMPIVLSEYFIFVSEPYDSMGQPTWKQLASYKGTNEMKLKSWLMRNGYQWFERFKKKRNTVSEVQSEWLEYVDYETLLLIDREEDELTDEQLLCRQRLDKAISLLSEKDKDILHILFFEKLHWEDAFAELSHYIRPTGGVEVMQQWDDKRKQTALSALKTRALIHLTNKFNSIK